MKIVDLNVLLYAVNSEAEAHQRARQWWEAALNGDETIGLPWMVILGFLRVATNPRVFPRPLSPEAAMAKVDAWLDRHHVVIAREKDTHWKILKTHLGKGTAGNQTTDAHLAALAISHDAALVSTDRDFGRFRNLRWEDPVGVP